MRRILSVILLAYSNYTFSEESLIGVWQSDEARSLAHMATLPNITNKEHQFFTDDFFGKVKFEFTKNTIKRESVIDGNKYFLEFNYSATYLGNNSFKLNYSDNNGAIETSETIYFENSCYYVIFSNKGQREYFCRIK